MSQRAYQHTLPELKRMCGVLFISTTNISNTKDAFVGKLLDFLGRPTAKAGRPPMKRRQVSTDYADLPGIEGSRIVEDEGSNMDDSISNTFPTDHQLRQWTRAYVRCCNPHKVTVQHALDMATDKFGMDLTSKYTRIKELLVEEF